MKNKQSKKAFIILVIIGAALLIGSVAVYINSANFAKTAQETTATITRIETEYDTDSDGDTTITHIVFVKFEVAGKEYSGKLDFYSAGMREGGKVTILYDPDNPQKFRSKSGSKSATIIMAIMGIVVLFAGFISIFNPGRGRKNKRKDFLMQNGKKVLANVTDIVQGKVIVNNRQSLNIICEYYDETGANTYQFKSENLWLDTPLFYENRIYPQIAVYVDNNKWDKYYVDSESWLNELGT